MRPALKRHLPVLPAVLFADDAGPRLFISTLTRRAGLVDETAYCRQCYKQVLSLRQAGLRESLY